MVLEYLNDHGTVGPLNVVQLEHTLIMQQLKNNVKRTKLIRTANFVEV